MQTASADPTVLRFVPGQNPGTFSYDSFFVPWAKKVTDDSHGALTIDLRGGMAIANVTNMYDRVMSDVVQIGFVLYNYVQGKFPYSEVAALPNTAPNGEEGSARCGASIRAARSTPNTIRRSRSSSLALAAIARASHVPRPRRSRT